MTSTGQFKSSTSETPDKGQPSKYIVTLKSSTFQKDTILLRERAEINGSKPRYEGSDNSHTEILHDEKDT